MANEISCGRCGHLLEDVGSQNVPAGKREHDAQQADRGRLTCPGCGHETTLPETSSESETKSWENEGGSAWGHDEGPWEG